MDKLKAFARHYMQAIGGPHALAALKLLKSEDWLSALQRVDPPKPNQFRTSTDYRRAALAGFFRKAIVPADKERLYKAAVSEFMESESVNKVTNIRLRRLGKMMSGVVPYESNLHFAYGGLVIKWRAELRRVLGPLPDRLEPLFSGGATTEHSGLRKTIPDKLSSSPGYYASPIVHLLHEHFFGNTVLGSSTPRYVVGNHFFTVPKNSKTDRGCCKEATGSLAGQLAVGKYLKDRHKIAYKANLRKLPDLHRALAKEGSLTGNLATIDLRRASNSLTYELIKLLVPEEWFDVLNSLRAPFTTIDGQLHQLEMFSSMGNGFTFELQTLVFRSLCSILTNGTVSVFGDDIIVPTDIASTIIRVLQYFGFETNSDKTFVEGPFRESCGGDYFNGILVRPEYLKELPTEPQHWISIANKLYKLGLEGTKPWRYCVEQVPTVYRVYGPETLGDLCLNVADPQPTMRYSTEHKAWLPYWTIIRPEFHIVDLDKHFGPEVRIAARLIGVRKRIAINPKPLRGRLGYVITYGVNDEWWEHIKRGRYDLALGV